MLARTILIAAVILLPAGAQALPPVCPLPGLTDRCETWAGSYDHAGGHGDGVGADVGLSVVVSSDGATVYSAGYSRDDGTGLDAVVVARDAVTGQQRWTHRFDGGGGVTDAALGVAVSLDGSRLYAAGTQDSQSLSTADYLMLALDAETGERLWSSRYDNGGQDFGQGLAVGPPNTEDPRAGADRVYVTGQSYDGSNLDSATVAVDGITGDIVWTARYAEATGFLPVDSTYRVAVDPAGERVAVAGDRFNEELSTFDALAVVYDTGIHDDEEERTGGREMWSARYPRAVGSRLAFSPAGDALYVGGHAWRTSHANLFSAATDYLAWSLDAATGTQRWAERWSGFGVNGGQNAVTDLALSPDGSRVYLTGLASGVAEGDDEVGTVAYASSGGPPVWTSRYGGPGHAGDAALAMDVAADGRLYVSGVSAPAFERPFEVNTPSVYQALSVEPPQGDALTLSLDPGTGRVMWTARRNAGEMGEEAGFAWDVAVAPDGGAVFTTGITGRRVDRADQDPSDGRGNRFDLTTVAYATG